MTKMLVQLLLNTVFGMLDQLLSKENMVLVADRVLDTLEDLIADTENTIDDRLLPHIKRFRETFNIPDNDLPPPEEEPPA